MKTTVQYKKSTANWNAPFTFISSNEYHDTLLAYWECNQNVSKVQASYSKDDQKCGCLVRLHFLEWKKWKKRSSSYKWCQRKDAGYSTWKPPLQPHIHNPTGGHQSVLCQQKLWTISFTLTIFSCIRNCTGQTSIIKWYTPSECWINCLPMLNFTC